MNLCIPVDADHGISSRVCSHFGSAPVFMIVNAATSDCRAIANGNRHGGHDRCLPLASLQGESIDAFVLGSIGRGALSKLVDAGIVVYHADEVTVEQVLTALHADCLLRVSPDMACARHRHDAPSGSG